MSQKTLKQLAAEKALTYISKGERLGVGTGSTVDCLIALLPEVRHHIDVVVSSSERSTEQLLELGFKVLPMTDVESLTLYIDGADEINDKLQMIKGGGAALTREKIVAAHADRFICIADQSKYVDVLGKFPLPVEVIPMALGHVQRELNKLGDARVREGVITDNGNPIIDVFGLKITDPIALETHINQIVGVVTNGIFAHRPADVLVLATDNGVQVIEVK
ncbi:ribose-5-phosphate isomerase RpiA [Wohlfahrtiimonas chitiniclastica]|uniref:ribose-5-phosphate isomerase RpiA n=1 Tax=Wohlfahrtiimonas chitiniclastica TaxID=400946 RepID=UPI0007B696B5|nr:ribose-5-phosphate isomerase RpiA [Wohlfahrtiimonas chitiniclastica]KZX36360.1 ribose 5-phosphate isomerase A [Wohlfahrtiimonas chitiniclastica]